MTDGNTGTHPENEGMKVWIPQYKACRSVHTIEKESHNLHSLRPLKRNDDYTPYNRSSPSNYNVVEHSVPEKLQNFRLLNTSFLMATIESITSYRTKTMHENLCRIESDILRCRNQLLELEGFYLGQNKGVDQRRATLEQRLFDLYREKRAEESSCWRDQLWLKRDLISLLKEYLDLERRKTLISEILEDNYSVSQNDDRGAMQKT